MCKPVQWNSLCMLVVPLAVLNILWHLFLIRIQTMENCTWFVNLMIWHDFMGSAHERQTYGSWKLGGGGAFIDKKKLKCNSKAPKWCFIQNYFFIFGGYVDPSSLPRTWEMATVHPCRAILPLPPVLHFECLFYRSINHQKGRVPKDSLMTHHYHRGCQMMGWV